MSGQWLHTWAIRDPATGRFILTNDDGSPSWEWPNRNGYLPVLQNDDVYIKHVEHFNKILANSATYIRAGNTLAGATPVVFTIDAQPDVPRNISFAFVSHIQITAYTLIIAGKDAKGNTISDTFTDAAGWSGATAKAYATITSITLTARTGTGIGDTMNVGIGSILGLANNIDAATDIIKVTKSIAAGNAGDYSGDGVNVTANATNDTLDVSTGAAIVDGDNYTIRYESRLYTQA